MSFRVLVIPEDPTQNGYILRPLLSAILADAGKSQARVHVLTNPRLEGYDQAVAAIRNSLSDRYAHWDLWVFVPDADRMSTEASLALEKEMLAKGIDLVCCPAVPELELYACVAFREDMELSWAEARRHKQFKEVVFDRLLAFHGDPRAAGAGREEMMKTSLRPLQSLYQLCPELQRLRDQLVQHLGAG